jgi:hypothetical protein
MAKRVAKSSLPKAVVQEKRRTRSNKNPTIDVTVKKLVNKVRFKNKPKKSANPDQQQPDKTKKSSEQISTLITNGQINDEKLTEHKNKLIFQCNVCHLAFKTIQTLVTHVTNTHDGNIFFEDTSLLQKKENGVKPYKCDKCKQCFARSEDLNIHLRIHRNLPVFECHRCQRMFAQSINLANHVKKVHLEVVDPERLLEIKADNFLLAKPLNAAGQLPSEKIDKGLSAPYEEVKLNDKIYFRKYKCPVYKCMLVFVKMTTLENHCRRNHLITDYTDSDLMVRDFFFV